MVIRLALCGLIAMSVLMLVMVVAFRATALESIVYDELTCEELLFSYDFNKAVVDDMVDYHAGCVDFAEGRLGTSNDVLSCRFIREHGLFVQGIANDLAATFNIKCANK